MLPITICSHAVVPQPGGWVPNILQKRKKERKKKATQMHKTKNEIPSDLPALRNSGKAMAVVCWTDKFFTADKF